ncbi:unnamed protein product [Rhizophagus irregularis]|nr:unnamed protein product [Rhizophagus irregularis]
MLLLCYENNISLENLDDNIFPSIKGGKIPLEDVVDNAYYSKHRKRLREKNILFLDQIISGDKSRLLLWKEILIKAYIPIFSQRKETKWYSDIRNLITSDGVHLNYNLTQLFGARVDNVEEARSYDITKKNRSLIAFYNSQFNSVIIGKIQGIDATQRPVIKHFHIDMSRYTDTHTYIYQCMEYGCAVNASLSTRSPCTFSANWKSLVPLLTDSQFAPSQLTNLIEFNIFDIFDFAKKKYDLIHQALTQNHVISPQLQDNIILDLLDSSTSRNDFISCAFAQISDLFDIPHVEFYSTIDKWPSAYRGELLAVLLALSVVPKNSKVRINTDSLNVITQFEKLKKSRFSHTSREYFKANNNFLWAILCRIILTLNLHVEMFKVVAHGDDMGNNYVDNLAKIAHTDQDCYIVFRRDASQKVHLLIEEIPTIEKSLFDLYDGWMCPICGLQDETFNHVWTCSGHYDIINNIRDKTVNHLLTWILEYNDNIQDFNALIALDIWDISCDPNVFTFIDLIKGIIPMSLSDLLSSWTTKKNVVDVLIQMRQFIFNEIFEEVWIPRCSHLKEFERSMGLTKKKKLEFKNVRSLPSNNSSNNIIHYDSLDSVRNYIYFGKNIIEFYTNLTS